MNVWGTLVGTQCGGMQIRLPMLCDVLSGQTHGEVLNIVHYIWRLIYLQRKEHAGHAVRSKVYCSDREHLVFTNGSLAIQTLEILVTCGLAQNASPS